MSMELVEVPYLDQLRTEVDELKRIVYGTPNDVSVTQAWASLDKVKEAISQLCPNHPQIMYHR